MTDQDRHPDSNNQLGDYPGTPRWVKVFGLAVIVLVALLIIGMLAGGGSHGPGRHLP